MPGLQNVELVKNGVKSMETEVGSGVENGVGIITLRREYAINALTPEMIGAITKSLKEWESDSRVSMVLMEGAGKKGFCSGGDVRWTREKVMAGENERVEAFFAAEYEMNRMIATYEKPIVALTHGVVMGGGIGLAGHARYRITTSNSRFAMPEAAIGLFCDVGVRSILAGIERQRALMFMLSAMMVGAGDAIGLDLSDVCIGDGDFSLVRSALIGAGSARDVEGEIRKIMAANAIEPARADFCDLADRFAPVFASSDWVEIYDRLGREVVKGSELGEIAATVFERCPTSNAVHVAGLDAARRQPDIAMVLKDDLALAHFMGGRSDFIEGVRAVLVDKDHKPRWQPDDIREVDRDAVLAVFGVNQESSSFMVRDL